MKVKSAGEKLTERIVHQKEVKRMFSARIKIMSRCPGISPKVINSK